MALRSTILHPASCPLLDTFIPLLRPHVFRQVLHSLYYHEVSIVDNTSDIHNSHRLILAVINPPVGTQSISRAVPEAAF